MMSRMKLRLAAVAITFAIVLGTPDAHADVHAAGVGLLAAPIALSTAIVGLLRPAAHSAGCASSSR